MRLGGDYNGEIRDRGQTVQHTEREIREYMDRAICPLVQADGGEARFVELCGDTVVIRLMGECSRCPIARGCFSEWLLDKLRAKFGHELQIRLVVEKPYFWDR